ncbi:sugar O-acetyltransferase [Limosilactobacillus gastricus]|uniref:Acetyltransferase n=1 Tax=Limosilactobacillus gastricus DSM 16045 TaxID=1423749 RepID=A0A0R1V7H7_9LACO|nr:sugar O-acetyltransferase [Limosilactobacillus gastricus]KRM01489.1 Galactoside O-acetyltransferase [Limosilactobacillus gastricus DSM 16045]QGF41030.1 sugar O-acetyltransferase [Limosilactobacillus gastricus]
MDTNRQKMLNGQPYDPSSPDLAKHRQQTHELCLEYNQTPESDVQKRTEIITTLVPHQGAGAYFQGPIQFDYGDNITVGQNFYANFNLTILDVCPVKIGDNVMLGPNVTIATPLHPLTYQQRNVRLQADGRETNYEYGQPITIGDNCWLAANVTVCPGVAIGKGCVIGAGSVVTNDLPDNCLAVGAPARVIRQITADDRLTEFPY